MLICSAVILVKDTIMFLNAKENNNRITKNKGRRDDLRGHQGY